MANFSGKFLVARPTLHDKFFGKTVVLLLQHNDEGAFGLIVNRPAEVEDLPFPMYIGGPCKFQGVMMLHAHPEWLEEDEREEVCPGVFLGNAECVGRASEAAKDDLPVRFRMFSGYSGWGPNQLEREMTEGSWAVVPAQAEELFDTPVEDLWAKLVPSMIPRPSPN